MSNSKAKRDIYEHYIDSDGLVTVDRDPAIRSTGNGLMHLGLLHTMLSDLNMLNNIDTSNFTRTVLSCQEPGIPGVYDRNPGRQDQNGHDDITGVVAGSIVNNAKFHNDVAMHGLTNLFIYNNDNKLELRDFLGRQIFHVMFWLLSTKKWYFRPLLPILVGKLMLFKPSSYKILLEYMMVSSLSTLYPFIKRLKGFWIKRSGLSAEVSRYFNQDHPLVVLAKSIEGAQ